MTSYDANASAERYLHLSPGLRAFTGRKTIRECDLSRECLLAYLKSKDEIRNIDKLVNITVQKLDGADFIVALDCQHCQTSVLKTEIEEAEGIRAIRQELFLFKEQAGEQADTPLSNDFVLSEDCTVVLCVKPKTGISNACC
jgi:hypothetical protein